MLQLAPSSHIQHPHAAHQSQGSIPQSWCRIEFSHEYDTLCSCRTEEWPSIRKEYIKKIKQTSKSKAEVDLVSVQPAIFTNTLWFFWYTQYWFMFIQLFYCNCQLVHIAFWVILCFMFWLKQVTNILKSSKLLCWPEELSYFMWWQTSKLAKKTLKTSRIMKKLSWLSFVVSAVQSRLYYNYR